MIYLYYSESIDLIKLSMSEICEMDKVLKYDCNLTNFNHIYNELMTNDLFGNNKYAYCENIKSLENKVKKNSTFLSQLIEIGNSQSSTLFIRLNKVINSSNPHIASLAGYYQYINIPTDKKNLINYLQDYTRNNNINISKYNLEYLLDLYDNNYNMTHLELEKLSLIENGIEIDEEVISKYASKNVKTDIWKLTELILQHKYKEANHIVDIMLEDGATIFEIVALYHTQLKFYYEVKILSDSSSYKQIASILRQNEYRIKKAMGLLNKISLISIQTQYIKLSNLDYKIKVGSIDPSIAMSLFLNRNN